MVVYKNEQLAPGVHTMLMSNIATPDSGSLVLFDYAIYSCASVSFYFCDIVLTMYMAVF